MKYVTFNLADYASFVLKLFLNFRDKEIERG